MTKPTSTVGNSNVSAKLLLASGPARKLLFRKVFRLRLNVNGNPIFAVFGKQFLHAVF